MPPHTSGGRSCLPPCLRSSARSTTWGPCPSAKMTKSRYFNVNCFEFDLFDIRGRFIYLTCLCCVWTGCPWTLQRPADRQSSAGLQEKVRHLHRACAEREGQRNHSPCRHPPQQGEPHLHLGKKSCANVHTQSHITEADGCKSIPRSLTWTCWHSNLCCVLM